MSFRQYERLDVRLDATIYSRDVAMSGSVENLSITGARLRCFTNPLRPGDVIEISALGHIQRSTVVWTATLHIGVHFLTPLVGGPLYALLARDPALLKRNILVGQPLESRPNRKMI